MYTGVEEHHRFFAAHASVGENQIDQRAGE